MRPVGAGADQLRGWRIAVRRGTSRYVMTPRAAAPWRRFRAGEGSARWDEPEAARRPVIVPTGARQPLPSGPAVPQSRGSAALRRGFLRAAGPWRNEGGGCSNSHLWRGRAPGPAVMVPVVVPAEGWDWRDSAGPRRPSRRLSGGPEPGRGTGRCGSTQTVMALYDYRHRSVTSLTSSPVTVTRMG